MNNIIISDISYNLTDKINFYFKATNYNEYVEIDYNTLDNSYNSTIIYENKGNNLIVEELFI